MSNGAKPADTEKDILAIRSVDQYRTVKELVEKSQPSSIYYTLLFLSAFIVTAGLLLGNGPIVIGGMLVTPVLTPVLYIALGINIGEIASIRAAGYLILKSVGLIIVGGIILALIFGTSDSTITIENSIRTAALYFLVALAAGIAGTFAWARKDVIDILPGVAIAVALVPPLAFTGIGLATLDFMLARSNFLIFLFNMFGIIVGSLIVFSMLQFYKTKETVHRKEVQAEMERKVKEGE